MRKVQTAAPDAAEDIRADRSDQDDRLHDRMLAVGDAIGAFIEWWGFKAIHGKIWSLLASSRYPLPQTEIATRLGVSRSLVSGAMSELTEFRLVKAVGQHRNAPYVARFDVWSTIADVLRTREWMLIERVRVALDAAILEGEAQQAAGAASVYDLQRTRLLLRMTEVAQAALQTIIAIASARMPRGFAGWLRRAVQLVADLRQLQ
jgi:DNA-binding transcriptional regulator GbsR (MarR family)